MTGKKKRTELPVARREAGQRLDLFLVDSLPDTSRKQAKRLIDGHRVAINGRIEPMASRILAPGERVVVSHLETKVDGPPPPLSILYEDEDCLAVMKPAGIPSGPTRDAARIHAAKLAEDFSGRSLTLLHRLDKDTSGVLLLAKTKAFATGLLQAFRDREVDKTYLALVPGRPQATFGVSCHLREGEGGRMLVVRSGGMKAETTFRTLASKAGYALLEARPKTGRTHQIRVHLAQAGYPILGDSTYGGDAEVGEEPVPRQMLHAWVLAFEHPTLGTRLRVVAPPPEDFRQLAESLLGTRLPLPGSTGADESRTTKQGAGSEPGVHGKRPRK